MGRRVSFFRWVSWRVRRPGRVLEVYEHDRHDFAKAYLVAQAEASGVSEILSFDLPIDRASTATRREP